MSSKAVSVHLPLTRTLAGLSLHLGRLGLALDGPEFQIKERPSVAELIEPALRMTVLAAQVHAGMWRRNGYSLVDQVRKKPLVQFCVCIRICCGYWPIITIGFWA